MNFLDERLPERFWNKVSPCPMTGCWIWTAYMNEAGYGVVSSGRRARAAYRVAYEALVGPVGPGLELDHRTCRTPLCCNPSHLEPVTHAENVRRGQAGVFHAKKTQCPSGHPYDEANTYRYRPKGKRNPKRICRACLAARARRERAEEKERSHEQGKR